MYSGAVVHRGTVLHGYVSEACLALSICVYHHENTA